MRSAEEIRESAGIRINSVISSFTIHALDAAINAARKEAIEAAITIDSKDGGLITIPELLNLIKEIK